MRGTRASATAAGGARQVRDRVESAGEANRKEVYIGGDRKRGGQNNGQNSIAYSKSMSEDINAVHNLISDQFRLPACTPGGAGARGRITLILP